MIEFYLHKEDVPGSEDVPAGAISLRELTLLEPLWNEVREKSGFEFPWSCLTGAIIPSAIVAMAFDICTQRHFAANPDFYFTHKASKPYMTLYDDMLNILEKAVKNHAGLRIEDD